MDRLPVSIVVSTRNKEEIQNAGLLGADVIEIRLDLLTRPFLIPEMLEGLILPPLIITLRSRSEGGLFFGTAEEWRTMVEPWIEKAVYIDIETAYRDHARDFQSQGKKVISSWHTPLMPSLDALTEKERFLRLFGEIPKIVVSPVTSEDLLSLLSFTLRAQKPLCTGIMGVRFRYGRILLPLFGSQFAFCHAGVPTAEGQYHIQDFRTLFEKLLE
jgi:3-dehydroquinate dehydratase-1